MIDQPKKKAFSQNILRKTNMPASKFSFYLTISINQFINLAICRQQKFSEFAINHDLNIREARPGDTHEKNFYFNIRRLEKQNLLSCEWFWLGWDEFKAFVSCIRSKLIIFLICHNIKSSFSHLFTKFYSTLTGI